MQRCGATEVERMQVIERLKAGQSYEDAIAPLVRTVEAAWFEMNREHLLEVAGVKKPAKPKA